MTNGQQLKLTLNVALTIEGNRLSDSLIFPKRMPQAWLLRLYLFEIKRYTIMNDEILTMDYYTSVDLHWSNT